MTILIISILFIFALYRVLNYEPKDEMEKEIFKLNGEMTGLSENMRKWYKNIPYRDQIRYESIYETSKFRVKVFRGMKSYSEKVIERKKRLINDFKEEFESELKSQHREERLKKLLK